MPAPTNPQADIFEPVAALLESATEVKSYFGAKHLSANGAPPRYVWVPTTGTPGAAMEVGDYPRGLVDVAMTFEVHCWHGTFDQAWALLVNLVSALFQTEAVHYEIGTVDALPSEDGLNGWVLTVPVMVRVPVFETDMPTARFVPVVIETVAIDGSQGIFGDGILDAGEPDVGGP